MIAYNTIIHTSTHDYNSHPMWLKRIDRPVEIGKHVWIGASQESPYRGKISV
jgi:acetyltransferase-like isoleucine patch superfamily enzyme